jgi:5-methyltetrahydrofolate--homocysteine methyltransferase
MNGWKERLAAKRLLIADGALGTELAKRGLAAGETPERWNLDRSSEVLAVARSYVEAGADIILTNTFGGSPLKLAKVGLQAQVAEVNFRGVELAKEAAGGKALVFASIGPTGEFMAPAGTIEEAEMVACFAEQVRAIAAASPDGIVMETMSDLGEAKAALRAIRENSNLPAVVSMTFQKGARGYATMMGVTPAQAAEALEAAHADMVGANCGAGIDDIVEVARLMRPATTLPLWFKPNAGLPQLIDGKTVFGETPETMVKRLADLVKAGASVVGGCCGTTPDHIRLFVAAARKLVNRPSS